MEANFRVVEKKEQCLHHHLYTYAPPSYSSPAFLFKKNAVTVVGKVNVDDTMSEAVSKYYNHLHTFLWKKCQATQAIISTSGHSLTAGSLAVFLSACVTYMPAVGKTSYDTNCIHARFTSPNILVTQFLLETLELMERLKLCRTRKPQQCLQRECSHFFFFFSPKKQGNCAL